MLDVRQWTHSDWPSSTAALVMLPELVASSAHQDGTSAQAQIANVGDKTLGIASAMASDRHIQATRSVDLAHFRIRVREYRLRQESALLHP